MNNFDFEQKEFNKKNKDIVEINEKIYQEQKDKYKQFLNKEDRFEYGDVVYIPYTVTGMTNNEYDLLYTGGDFMLDDSGFMNSKETVWYKEHVNKTGVSEGQVLSWNQITGKAPLVLLDFYMRYKNKFGCLTELFHFVSSIPHRKEPVYNDVELYSWLYKENDYTFTEIVPEKEVILIQTMLYGPKSVYFDQLEIQQWAIDNGLDEKYGVITDDTLISILEKIENEDS